MESFNNSNDENKMSANCQNVVNSQEMVALFNFLGT